ncbi:uncharacterized protein LOC123575984 [Leopardus geoffroyi]|uniref:uncharacterized protein LOC123575984 n=1 Tax=Leopardus geoffroyi TaxID=46844 RepID=UPI001E25E6EF|nr:uncharacterized protein LOC123575984 [Leopardus geoffroyi]
METRSFTFSYFLPPAAYSSGDDFLTQKDPGKPGAEVTRWRLHTETVRPGGAVAGASGCLGPKHPPFIPTRAAQAKDQPVPRTSGLRTPSPLCHCPLAPVFCAVPAGSHAASPSKDGTAGRRLGDSANRLWRRTAAPKEFPELDPSWLSVPLYGDWDATRRAWERGQTVLESSRGTRRHPPSSTGNLALGNYLANAQTLSHRNNYHGSKCGMGEN